MQGALVTNLSSNVQLVRVMGTLIGEAGLFANWEGYTDNDSMGNIYRALNFGW